MKQPPQQGRQDQSNPQPSSRPISEMINLGPQSVAWLNELGIQDEEDLRKHDILDVYLEIKARHPRKATLMMLWALQGALLDINCLYLPNEIKDQLKKELAERK